ncbi:MAG: cupredoxin domain-containing protein [Nitrospinota bacterium]|jgi:plastocyanin|nr:cupredoxin domain-containing protein [Nitrospinota bacterium]
MPRDTLDAAERSGPPAGRWLPGMVLEILGLAAAGCAPVSTVEGRARKVRAGEEAISIEAGSFHFRPNRILASAGKNLELKVRNGASLGHNLTVKTLDGKVILSLDLPAGETRPGTSRLPEAGECILYCDKPGHRTFGMEGVLIAR